MARRKPHRGRRSRRNWFMRMSVAKRAAVCICGVLLVFIASGALYVAAKLGKIDTQEIAEEDIIINEEVEQLEDLGDGYLNVALFGVDSREGDLEQGTRTDCLIVASLNKETKEIRMISVYRDTVLDLSEGTLQKCNAAYSFGGPTMAINMLNMNLDLDIQKYVTVNFGVLAEVIDLLGGVEIDLKQEEIEYLNEYIEETAEVSGKEAHFVSEAGVQTMDGVQATTYARIRSTEGGDFTRTERQRLVIEKMVEKAQKSDLATINSIIDKVLPTISTNFTGTEILSYAQYFSQYKLGENAGFPFDKTTDTISGLGSIVIPVDLADNVKQLHEFLFGKTDYSVSSAVQSISSAIVARVGQRDAVDDAILGTQTYEEDPQDAPGYYSDQYYNNYPTGGDVQPDNPSNDVPGNQTPETPPDTTDPGTDIPPDTTDPGGDVQPDPGGEEIVQ